MSGEIQKDEMGQMRNPQFPGNRFRVTGPLGRFDSRQRGFAPTSSRHLLWARAIVTKFRAGKSAAAWQPAAMVQARTTGAWNLLLRAFVTQIWMHAAAERAQRKENSSGVAPAFQQLQGFSPSLRRVDVERLGLPINTRAGSESAEPVGIHFLPPMLNRHLLAARLAHSDSLPPVRNYPWLPGAMTVAPRAGRSRQPMSLAFDESGDSNEFTPAPGGMALRITRRHGRVEEQRLRYRREMAVEEGHVRAGEMTLVSNRATPPHKGHDIGFEAESRVENSRTEPVIDTAQITDQVLKQLDRRLIAARERMGKI
jgi:hypothetical protein